jgi:hypothetical protein
MAKRSTGNLGLILLFLLGALWAPPVSGKTGDYKKEAKAALDGEKWDTLEKLSRAELDEDPDYKAARAYLSLALAGKGQFKEAVAELKALKEAGHNPTRDLRGLNNPLEKLVNIIYMTCWANFNADFNRRVWSDVFQAFSDTHAVRIPASRLLMAALLKEDQVEIDRMEAWFNGMLETYQDNRVKRRDLSDSYVRGYLRAERATPRILQMATANYKEAWADAEDRHKGIQDPLERRDLCDVDADHFYWDLCLALALSQQYDPPENVLAEREAEPGARFEDITEEAGLGALRAGRVAASDYNQDGYADLCFSGRLFRNEKGKGFKEVTQEAGLDKTGTGALFFDYDNDGFLDILVTAHPHPHLFRNRGKKGRYGFENVTLKAGLDRLKVKAAPEGCAVMDMDNDGWLDFYMAVYERPFPVGHPDLLARNNGNGTFSDASEASNILGSGVLVGRGVACSDYDFDGDTDIYVSNYRLLINFLWQNDGAGRFLNIGEAHHLQGFDEKGSFGHTIGSCWGDVDLDGDFDLFCANLAHPRFIQQGFSNLSLLYINAGPAEGFRFDEERRARGIRFQETHSDPAFADYDNDGDLDLYITATYKGAPSAFYQNDGKGFFSPVTFLSRSVVFDGWGQAWFDMENDGDLDHVIGSGRGVRLHRNLGNDNQWVKVRLKGKGKNRFGIGARVKVITEKGASFLREVHAGRGTQSQDDTLLHFGLGPDAASVKVEVTWPTGNVRVGRGKANRTVEVKQVKGYPK